jgi:phosphopantothenoylcysteine decarboxylase / phosphopantothenate---cysteine ligase
VLGVCGGIAAYKAVEVCRRLVDAGAFVSPVLTRDATRFVGALTFSALASEPVRSSLWDEPEPIPHTTLGRRADLVVVAPATARLLGSYAAGISSDLLTATLLATRAPVLLCPAMHTEMWEHPAVMDNVARLRGRGVRILEPAAGRLAGGDVGSGRLPEPVDILAAAEAVASALSSESPGHLGRASGLPTISRSGPGPASHPGHGDLTGVTALVTAGGTREPIDPVRFIGNRSSGKQGYAIAAELAARHAQVSLISTVDLPDPPGVEVVRLETAAEMEAAVLARAPRSDVVVMAAAVADFRPKEIAPEKIKKTGGAPDIVLEPTTDILAGLGSRRRPGQLLVGFAAETARPDDGGDELRRSARQKLESKGVDLVVANDVAAPGVGFAHDTNAVLIIGTDGFETDVPLSTKAEIARAVVDAVARLRHLRSRDDQESS